MKRRITCLILMALMGVVAGCSLSAREINLKSQSEKTDVFAEVNGEGPSPKGFVDLIIKTSIKTHLEGYYFIEPAKTFHGQEGYPVLINIDGQAITWRLTGQKEIIPREKETHNPEEGEGMRYMLNKEIRLAPGPHKIFFGLPGDKINKEVNLTFIEGNAKNILEFKPIYCARKGRIRSFLLGVRRVELFYNGNRIL